MQTIPSSSSRIEAPSSDIAGKRPVRRARTEPKPPTPMESPFNHHRKDQLTWSHTSLHLPPLAYTASSSSSGSSDTPPSMPNFGVMSPIKHNISSGCTCGVNCMCSGCVEHKRSENARNKCGDGCGNCIDPSLVSLPTGPMAAGSCCGSSSGSSNNNNESFLDRFFACAAALPPPPGHRGMPFQLNPIDTTVYPNVPPVRLRKLCCGGQCSCNGRCPCNNSCTGCADEVREGPGVSYERQNRL